MYFEIVKEKKKKKKEWKCVWTMLAVGYYFIYYSNGGLLRFSFIGWVQ